MTDAREVVHMGINDVLKGWFPDWDGDKRLQFKMELDSHLITRAEKLIVVKAVQAKEEWAMRVEMAESASSRVAGRLHQLAAEHTALLNTMKIVNARCKELERELCEARGRVKDGREPIGSASVQLSLGASPKTSRPI